MIITYAHQADPKGTRFRQDASDPTPSWAVEVEEAAQPLTYQDRAEQALRGLPEEFQALVRSQAYSRGHSAGEDEVYMIMGELAGELQTAFDAYNARVGK